MGWKNLLRRVPVVVDSAVVRRCQYGKTYDP